MVTPRNLAELLLKEVPGINLALSLHAPTQELRQQIVPTARIYPINKLLEVVDERLNEGSFATNLNHTPIHTFYLLQCLIEVTRGFSVISTLPEPHPCVCAILDIFFPSSCCLAYFSIDLDLT